MYLIVAEKESVPTYYIRKPLWNGSLGKYDQLMPRAFILLNLYCRQAVRHMLNLLHFDDYPDVQQKARGIWNYEKHCSWLLHNDFDYHACSAFVASIFNFYYELWKVNFLGKFHCADSMK